MGAASLGLAEALCFAGLLFCSVFLSRGTVSVAFHGHTGEGPQSFRSQASGRSAFSLFMSEGIALSPWGEFLSEPSH